MTGKGYSPLRRWLREERAKNWPAELLRQERERQLGTLGWVLEERGGLWYRVDRLGQPRDVYYTGAIRWDGSPA